MKAYKAINTDNPSIEGRLFYEIDNQILMLATPIKRQCFYLKDTYYRLKEHGWLQEVDLLEEKWIHPHLYKPIKTEVYARRKEGTNHSGSL